MPEVRVFAEGSLYYIAASSTGGGWITASAAPSSNGPIGYVQAGMAHTSAARVVTITDRGTPTHHKRIGSEPIEVTFTFLEGITANNPVNLSATAGAASLPLLHFVHKATAVEDGAVQYYLYTHGALISDGWTEAEEGVQKQQTWRFTKMVGPTASGYIG